MHSKISLLLALVAPLVSGLTLDIPTNPTSGGEVTITWTSAAGDPPTFSVELVNEVFHNAFAIANNVQPETGTITLQLPVVPAGSGYTLQAVNIGDITQVYSSTGTFSIGATVSSSVSGSSTLTSASGLTTSTAPATTRSIASSSFGVTSSGLAASQSASTTAASSTPSSAAVSILRTAISVGGLAGVILSVVAGAAIVGL